MTGRPGTASGRAAIMMLVVLSRRQRLAIRLVRLYPPFMGAGIAAMCDKTLYVRLTEAP